MDNLVSHDFGTKELSAKNAFVVGGSGGIGAFIAKALSAHFAVTTHGRKKADIPYEFTEDSCGALVASPVYAHAQKADVLCICYGPFLQASVEATAPAQWQSLVFWNLTMPGILTSAALPHMRQCGFGRILLFGGTGTDSIGGFRTNAAYAAAKTGLCSLVKSVALEYAQYGITANAILPGFVRTEYTDSATQKTLEQKMPQKKLITPEEIAKSALHLILSPEINGALLTIDAGWHRA
ncbi:MAG: SDR family oxidoreductase [Treponemataceae bacterium]|nr:MAG: SDR family oxidoreductase [Treponemataceae bacterium]